MRSKDKFDKELREVLAKMYEFELRVFEEYAKNNDEYLEKTDDDSGEESKCRKFQKMIQNCKCWTCFLRSVRLSCRGMFNVNIED